MYPSETEFVPALTLAAAKAKEFLATLEKRRPAAPFDAPEPWSIPEEGHGAPTAIGLLWDRFGQAFSGSSGPRYWGYVHGGLTPAALAADWICSAVDQTGQMHGDSPGVAIEQETIGMLRELFGLPPSHQGIFLSGGSMANFTGLAAAVQRLGRRFGVNVSQDGAAALGELHVLTGVCHACVPRAIGLLGFGRAAVEYLPLEPGRERVDVAALAARLDELEGKPVIIVGNAGTVTTGDIDDLDALGRLAEQHDSHLHVDGAFGLFAAASPKRRDLIRGIERADTIAGDAHKWLNVPYDSGFLFSRHLDHQLEMFKNVSLYLPEPTADPRNVPNLGPENSRRVRAIPAWATLQAYGRAGHGEIVDRCCDLAEELGARLQQERGFRLLAPVRLNVVCFELIGSGGPLGEAATKAFADRLIADGRVRVSNSIYEGQACIRLSIINWRTEPHDLDIAMDAFRACHAETVA